MMVLSRIETLFCVLVFWAVFQQRSVCQSLPSNAEDSEAVSIHNAAVLANEETEYRSALDRIDRFLVTYPESLFGATMLQHKLETGIRLGLGCEHATDAAIRIRNHDWTRSLDLSGTLVAEGCAGDVTLELLGDYTHLMDTASPDIVAEYYRVLSKLLIERGDMYGAQLALASGLDLLTERFDVLPCSRAVLLLIAEAEKRLTSMNDISLPDLACGSSDERSIIVPQRAVHKSS